MKTTYEEIVDVPAIGLRENTRNMNELLKKANLEKLQPAVKNKERVLVIGIDEQLDFMENGALGVPGSHGDIARFTKWIYDNMDKIAKIAISLDTHNPFQIFHPCWWIDENGDNPNPFTVITLKDLDDGKYFPVVDPIRSRNYVEGLTNKGKKALCIWPYHCLQGDVGSALENQFSNMVYFHSVAKKTVVERIVKGVEPFTEMYGIFAPEFTDKGIVDLSIFNKFASKDGQPLYDKIVIGGEARSHCVLESVRQLLEYFSNKPEVTQKVYFLEDCSSDIPSFETVTQQAFDEFKNKYKINIVKSTDFNL